VGMHTTDERQVMSSQGKSFSIGTQLLSGRDRYGNGEGAS